jgi:multiple sugar transport system ATP-binding protein
MSSIRFEKVKKRFKDTEVIKELDLEIIDGEFFTFVGPSGCGKSTILNVIAGLEPVTEGKIYFDDTAVNELSPADRDVAMVFQSYALYPHMTVYDNIAFPLKMKKIKGPAIDEEVKRISALLGLEDLLGRKPRELSGGQRQRVALGRAIIRRPRVFLMDEPLSNLDARLRVEMRAELKRLHQELNITTVYVTHDQAEAMGLSERMAVIHQGKIQQCGTPVEVYSRPANIFVAGFIGSPPMNLVPAAKIKSGAPDTDKRWKTGLLAGIRPENINVSDKRFETDKEVTVSVVEPAGPFNWVDFIWNGERMKGISEVGIELKAGSKAFIKFDPGKALLFDPDSRQLL